MLGRVLLIFQWNDLVRNMTFRNLRIRYKGSVLGFLWTMVNPLLMMLVYFVFISLLKIGIGLPRLLTGILIWQFFAMCLSDSVNVITGFPTLIKRTYFPRLIFPLSMVLANLINFLLSLIVLAFFLVIYIFFVNPDYPIAMGYSILLLPFLILLQCTLIMGIASFISAANVYFKDIEHIVSVVLLAWFFMTPVMYPLTIVEPRISPALFSVYLLNPMTSLVISYRHLILGTPLPASFTFWISLLLSPLIMIAGIAFFWKNEPYFADEL